MSERMTDERIADLLTVSRNPDLACSHEMAGYLRECLSEIERLRYFVGNAGRLLSVVTLDSDIDEEQRADIINEAEAITGELL